MAMNEEKRLGGTGSADVGRGGKEPADDKKNSAASRARNRTVMLTPEMTGHVRALLYQEPEEEAPASNAGRRDPLTELLPPMDWSRPDQPPAAAEAPKNTADDDFNKDFASALNMEQKVEKNSSTSKIDQDVVHEAVAAAHQSPEPPKRAAAQPAFSVNPNASARPASASGAVTGAFKRPGAEFRGRAPAVAPSSKVVGFFVTFDKEKFGEVFEIRAGRWLVTSRPTDHGEFILIEDETISPLHAIVRATKEGKIQVLDQLSEFGTGVLRVGQSEEQEVSGTMVAVEHGDVLRLGERHFVVCTIPKVALPETEKDSEG
jgi:hypothetical protein